MTKKPVVFTISEITTIMIAAAQLIDPDTVAGSDADLIKAALYKLRTAVDRPGDNFVHINYSITKG